MNFTSSFQGKNVNNVKFHATLKKEIETEKGEGKVRDGVEAGGKSSERGLKISNKKKKRVKKNKTV